MIDDTRKKEIEAEEKLRLKIRGQEQSKQSCITCLVLIILAVFVIYLVSCSSSSDKDTSNSNQSNQAQEEAKKQEEIKKKEATVNEVSPIYCKNHKSFRLIKIDDWIKEGYPMFDGTNGFDDEDCKKAVSKLYDIDSNKQKLMNIADKKYWIGMNAKQLFYSIGVPSDTNSTTTIFGSSVQLIYGDPLYNATYIYLDNGIVSSYQN